MGGKRQRWQRKQQDRARHFPFLRGWLGPGVEHVRAGSPLSPRAGCLAPWRGPKGGQSLGSAWSWWGSTAGEQDLCSVTCTIRMRRSWQQLPKAGLGSGTDPAQDFGVPEQRRRSCLQEGTRSACGQQRTRAPRPRSMYVGDGSAVGPAHTCAQRCAGARNAQTSPSPQSRVCLKGFLFSNSVSLCEASPR